VRFDVSIGGRPASAFVVRHRGVVAAFLNRCSHASTELDWQPGRFFDTDNEYLVCATHGALFDATSGGCVGGPCLGRGGLRRVSVVENQGRVGWVPDAYVNAPGMPSNTPGPASSS
ncbi:MAG TPA: Rieske 2Fe-2S domain-containing protein, partial [Burkholderiaceae bacterium]|nr:Rieske 2Fe-2S domain-containing protein [Burkholderiaceae bacterium]